MTDNAKIREQLEAKSFVATVFESVSHAVDYRVVRLSDAIALLDAERPSVPLEPLRLLYNMAALNGKIPDNRDEIITAHMAELGFDVKETP